jgi:hypothetical protein
MISFDVVPFAGDTYGINNGQVTGATSSGTAWFALLTGGITCTTGAVDATLQGSYLPGSPAIVGSVTGSYDFVTNSFSGAWNVSVVGSLALGGDGTWAAQ